MRLSDRDRSQLAELERSLSSLQVDSPPVLESISRDFQVILRADRIGTYSYRIHDDSLEPEHFEILGAPCGRRQARERLAKFLRRNQSFPGAYGAARPHPKQRNRVVCFPPTVDWLRSLERQPKLWEAELGLPATVISQHLSDNLDPFLRPTGYDQHQMRVLLCDGETVLGYLGAAQAEPFTERQRLAAKQLVRPLCSRLKLEEQLRGGPLASAALDVALEAIPAPAYIVTSRGAIYAMNAAGKWWFRRDRRRVTDALLGSKRGELTRPAFRVTTITAAGFPEYHLAVKEPEPGLDPGRLAAAHARWGLTERQTEVLARVVAGAPNNVIAAELGLGQSTVEFHVTKILEKAEVTSRSELLVEFWTR